MIRLILLAAWLPSAHADPPHYIGDLSDKRASGHINDNDRYLYDLIQNKREFTDARGIRLYPLFAQPACEHGTLYMDATLDQLMLCNAARAFVPLPAGAWKDYTPSFTGFTIGNGTINSAKYSQIGKTVHVRIKVKLGSTSSMAGPLDISFPVAPSSSYVAADVLDGSVQIFDTGTARFMANVLFISANVFRLGWNAASGTYVTYGDVSSTAPMTWTTSDEFHVALTYEAQ